MLYKHAENISAKYVSNKSITPRENDLVTRWMYWSSKNKYIKIIHCYGNVL